MTVHAHGRVPARHWVLPPEPELVTRKCRRLPLEAVLVDPAAAFVLRLLVPVEYRVGKCNDVLTLVMLEEL